MEAFPFLMSPRRQILITGVSSELMRRFIAGVSSSEWSLCGISRSAETLTLPGVHLKSADLRDPASYAELIEEGAWILHAAAVTHARDPAEYEAVNVKGTRALVDLARERNAARFIFISSRTARLESGAYGRSKLHAEHYLQDTFPEWQIFRPAEVFGLSGAEGVEKLIRQAMNRRWIPVPHGVPGKLTPIHVDDVVRLLHQQIFQGPTNEVFPIHGPEAFTYRELIDLCAEVRGRRIQTLPVPRWVLQTASRLLATLQIPAGIVPDQVERLYSEKNDQPGSSDLISLRTYLNSFPEQGHAEHT